MGYGLTGDVRERAFFLLHGSGRNGKSTFVETYRAVLGGPGSGYAQKARFSSFLKKQNPGINDDIAHLAGARVVIATENDGSTNLDTSAVKELTGNDAVRARFLYGKEFEFVPQFKLFLVANHVPPIADDSRATWDRLHYINFNFRVPDEKVDKGLQLKLLGELEGILAKAVRACLEWQKGGLDPPDSVIQAGQRLEREMDLFGQFFEERLDATDRDAKVSGKVLYNEFRVWSKDARGGDP